MRLRNNIFAAALDEMKRRGIVKNQKELAQKMGVSEDTISRILKDRTDVTEDAISKLQTASGCLFNLQWLRGESDNMYPEEQKPQESAQIHADSFHEALDAYSRMVEYYREQAEQYKQMVLDQDALIQEHNEQIVTLKIEKTKLDKDLEHTRATLDAVRNNFDKQIAELAKRDETIRILQNALDGDKRGKFPFNSGVADGHQERTHYATDDAPKYNVEK